MEQEKAQMRFDTNEESHHEVPTILQIRTNGSCSYHCDCKRIILVEVKHAIFLAKILQCCTDVQNTPEISCLFSISLSFGNKLHFHQVPRPHESEHRAYSHPCFTLDELHRVHSTPTSQNLKRARISSLRGRSYYLQNVLKSPTDKFWKKAVGLVTYT